MSELSQTIARSKNYGDFVIRFQYVNPQPHEPGSDYEPALVICRPKRIQSRSAWVIMLSSAWKYVDNEKTSMHSAYMVESSFKIADMIGLGRSPHTAFRIAEAILENLEELINMPPVFKPVQAVGEATLHAGGRSYAVEVMN